VSAKRAGYAAQQAALLRALQTGERVPAGFAGDDFEAASSALLEKRTRAVAEAWPVLAHSLGPQFTALFECFARRVPPPVVGGGMADGLEFASSLDRSSLSEDAKAEWLLARGLLKRRGSHASPRRGIFVVARLLAEPARLLIVAHLPLVGRRHVTLLLPGRIGVLDRDR
jgi:hypothetical protein